MIGGRFMINELSKISKKHNIVLEEGVCSLWEFVSKNDLKRIVKLNKNLLDNDDAPSINDVLHIKEEIYVDAFIRVVGDNISCNVKGAYVPLDLKPEKFNKTVCLLGRYPNYIQKEIINNKEYLCLWWNY